MTDESIELYNNCLDYLEKNHKTDETKDVLKCWGKCFDQMEKNSKFIYFYILNFIIYFFKKVKE